jgi:hypothetical protein
VDLGVGEPGVVVDGAVHVVVAGASGVAGLAALEAVAAVDPPPAAGADDAELLDVDVDQLTRMGAFVAADGLSGRTVQERGSNFVMCALTVGLSSARPGS